MEGIFLTALINTAFPRGPKGTQGIHPRLPFLWIPLIPERMGVILPPRHAVTPRVALKGYNRDLLQALTTSSCFRLSGGLKGRGHFPRHVIESSKGRPGMPAGSGLQLPLVS